jgi:hypothetical protein
VADRRRDDFPNTFAGDLVPPEHGWGGRSADVLPGRSAQRRFVKKITVQLSYSHFTVYGLLQPGAVLYATTMDGCRSANRRREHAGAVVCALSLFVALVAGSALRPHYTTNTLPEPGAWTHVVKEVRPSQAQPVSATPSLEYLKAGEKAHSAPVSRKPFRNVWMTRDLPSNWDPLSPQTDWSVLPISFTAAQFQPRGAPWGASTADAVNRHTSSLFCIIRC